jgi:hypothetical protein
MRMDADRQRPTTGRAILARLAVVLLAVSTLTAPVLAQVYQLRHWSGQGVAPVYEGFDINDDGTFNMWFGYMNRNYEEELEIPAGVENRFEPGSPDRGQPTHFDPRRHKDVFRVILPKDFGSSKLVWSLTVRGKTEQIVATLGQVWQIDRKYTTRGGNSDKINSNTPPVVTVTPPTVSIARTASAELNISATDDGLPKRQGKAVGMTVEWAKYRGPGHVAFDQVKQRLADGKANVKVSFSEPGDYVLQAVVDDGSGELSGNFGYHCCWTDVQVKVTVSGASSSGANQ